jgi:hypothetical protein
MAAAGARTLPALMKKAKTSRSFPGAGRSGATSAKSSGEAPAA